jgi:hypothetical protein
VTGAKAKPRYGFKGYSVVAAAREAFRLSSDLGVALSELPLETARLVLRGMVQAVDAVREAEGKPAGLVEVIEIYEPHKLDDWKSREDWLDDLVRAWRALGKDDRAKFLMRVSGKEAA